MDTETSQQAEHLRKTGDLKGSEALCRKMLAVDPRHPGALNTLALIALQVGNTYEAVRLMLQAVESQPKNHRIRRNLCELFRRLGKIDEAIREGEEAIRLAPDDVESNYNLGVALQTREEHEAASAIFGRVLELDPEHNFAWNNLGVAQSKMGDDDAAFESHLRATEIDSRHKEAQTNVAAILIQRGDLQGATDRIEKALEVDKTFIKAHHHLSALKKYDKEDWDYEFLERSLCSSANLTPDDRMQLLFALGKAREDTGQYQLAMIAFLEANSLKRRGLGWSDEVAAREVDALMQCFDEPLPEEAAEGADPTAVFIVGMPRSGTTLVEQVLSSHPEVHGAGELKYFQMSLHAHPRVGMIEDFREWYPSLTDEDCKEIGDAYMEQLRRHSETSARITDKMPGNFHYIPFLRRCLPGAKIIHCMRDPMDSCLSNFTRLFNDAMDFAYDLEDLGNYYNRYIMLVQHWVKVVPRGFMRHQRYELMVDDFEAQARGLVEHIGLEWDDACLEFHRNRRKVRTASFAQVRKPLYRSSVARWKSYGDALDPLRAIVGEDYPHGVIVS